jgi:hypothetical protein
MSTLMTNFLKDIRLLAFSLSLHTEKISEQRDRMVRARSAAVMAEIIGGVMGTWVLIRESRQGRLRGLLERAIAYAVESSVARPELDVEIRVGDVKPVGRAIDVT